MASLPAMPDSPPPPSLCNPQAEYDLLCVLLRDRSVLETVADRLTQDDFSEPFLGRMFGMLVHETAAGRHANALTIRPLLQQDPDFAGFGGWPAIAEMTGVITMLYDWRGLASDLARFAKRRRMIAGFEKAIALAQDSTTAEHAMIDAADAALSQATDTVSSDRIITAGDLATGYLDTMDDPMPPGITSRRVTALDDAIGPIRKKDLVIGAGRPGMGKTATVLSYVIGAAGGGTTADEELSDSRSGVLVISLEMGADQLVERMLSDLTFDGRAGVPYELVRQRRLDRFQRMEIARASETLAALPLHIYDTSGLTIPKLERVVRRYKRKLAAQGQSLDLVVVDYLQLMTPTSKSTSRVDHITEISNGLKRIAKAQDVGMFALSQLSRQVEQRPDKRPQLSDLRESGSIEQDADVVVFFFRLEYYLRLTEPQGGTPEHDKWQATLDSVAGTIDFICAKKRHGRSNITRRGRFVPEYQAVR